MRMLKILTLFPLHNNATEKLSLFCSSHFIVAAKLLFLNASVQRVLHIKGDVDRLRRLL